MASTAALELVISLKDGASKGLGNIANQGGFLKNALSFAAGGAILKGIEAIGGGIVDVFSSSLDEAKQAQAGMAQLDAVLKSTGGSAGVTKEQVLALADSLSSSGGLSTATDDSVLAAENMLLTFTNIGKGAFPDATKAVLDMSTAMNNGATPSAEQLKGTAIQVGKALNDPIKGLTALSKVGVSFTADQKKVIEAMVKTGDTAGAQRLILAELNKEFGGSASAAASTFEGKMAHLGGVFDNIKQAIGERLLPILSKMMDWLGSPEVINGIKALADGLMNGIGKAIDFIGGVVNTVWPIIQPFVQNFIDFLKTIASGGDPFAALGTYFSNLFTLIGDALPNIISQLGEWGKALWNWIVEAWPKVMDALGTFIGNVWAWIVENGPTILAKLAEWTSAFLSWVWNDAIPALMGALGDLIGKVWAWIVENGPTILAKLWEWTQAFFKWVWDDAIPTLMKALGDLISKVWTWIVENGPTILAKLGEWTAAFFKWVWEDVLPQLPGWLWNIVSAVWNFISTNGPTILAKLGEWTTAFFNWVYTDVLPQIPGWLGSIASALWTWITTTASDLWTKLTTEWVPGLWNWITGPGGVIETLPGKLGEIASSIWTWITTTAGDALGKAIEIGKSILDGIMSGLGGAFKAIYDFLIDIATKVWNAIVAFFTGSAQSEANKPPPPNGGYVPPGGWGNTQPIGPPSPPKYPTPPPPPPRGGVGHQGLGNGQIFNVTVNAGMGANGRQIASDFVDELSSRLGVRVRNTAFSRGGA